MHDLHHLLNPLCRAADQPARAEALLTVLDWLRGAPRTDEAADRTGSRETLLIRELARDAALRRGVQDAIGALFDGADATNLFGVIGLPNERGFWSEGVERLLAKILPAPRDSHDLARLVRRAYPDEASVVRLQRLPPAVLVELMAAVAPAERPELRASLNRGFAEGFRLLAIRVQAHGLSSTMRRRSATRSVSGSPFYALTATSLELIGAWERDQPTAELIAAWNAQEFACRAAMEQIHARMQEQGVGVDAVYALDVMDRSLSRLGSMVAVMQAPAGEARLMAIRELLVRVVEIAHHDRSIRHLARINLRLLHQKIVERSAQTGEHYIATGRGDYTQIWFDAAGGGLLTTLTAAVKTGVSVMAHAVHLAPFATGFLYGLNYAASFLALQHCGLILATKQPAMTAATLAGIMRERRDADERREQMVEHTVRIVHSQLAAAAGNVVMVALGAAAFDVLWRVLTGHHWLAHADALAIYEDLSPVNSLTVIYAAETGVILWLSSLMGGWFDNWSACHRIPQGIAELRPGGFLRADRLERWSSAWRIHCAGWGTNVSLGFMLGFAPMIGGFFSLPIDVRHVTLSTGVLALAVSGLDADWFRGGRFVYAVGGIGVMFVLNLGVSFGLSLLTALRSFELPAGEVRGLLRHLLRRLVRQPLDFIRPK